MNSRPDLKLDWCSHQVAKYAVEHWHYSKRMPDPKSVKVGVWEAGRFVGVVIFSRGVASTNLSKGLGVKSTEVAELSRVALTTHQTPITRVVGIAIRMLRRQSPLLRVLVSYADQNQAHLGIIYQAGNWVYTGESARVPLFRDKSGRYIHDRACSATGFKRQYGRLTRVPNRSGLERVEQLPKYRYMMPLDAEIRARILPLAMPYPKRQKDSSEPSAIHAEEGGAAPTLALQDLFPMQTRMRVHG